MKNQSQHYVSLPIYITHLKPNRIYMLSIKKKIKVWWSIKIIRENKHAKISFTLTYLLHFYFTAIVFSGRSTNYIKIFTTQKKNSRTLNSYMLSNRVTITFNWRVIQIMLLFRNHMLNREIFFIIEE